MDPSPKTKNTQEKTMETTKHINKNGKMHLLNSTNIQATEMLFHFHPPPRFGFPDTSTIGAMLGSVFQRRSLGARGKKPLDCLWTTNKTHDTPSFLMQFKMKLSEFVVFGGFRKESNDRTPATHTCFMQRGLNRSVRRSPFSPHKTSQSVIILIICYFLPACFLVFPISLWAQLVKTPENNNNHDKQAKNLRHFVYYTNLPNLTRSHKNHHTTCAPVYWVAHFQAMRIFRYLTSETLLFFPPKKESNPWHNNNNNNNNNHNNRTRHTQNDIFAARGPLDQRDISRTWQQRGGVIFTREWWGQVFPLTLW